MISLAAAVIAACAMIALLVPHQATAFLPCKNGITTLCSSRKPPFGWPITSLAAAAVSWTDLALDYETRVEPVTASFVEEMIESFDVSRVRICASDSRKPKLLDVGCGTGSASVFAATEGGFEVTAVDNSPAMIGRLAERIEALGDDDLDFYCQVADGQSLPPEFADTFHYAMSSFAIIFFPDPLAGIKEMHRCLRPAGRAVISGWGDRGDSPAFRIVPEAVRSVAPELVASGSKDKPFIRSADEVAQLMTKAGFVDIEIKKDITRKLAIRSPEEYYERFALGSPPTRSMVEWMDENMGAAVASRFKDAVMRLAVERGGGRPDGPIEIISPAYFVYGTKPID